MPTAPMKNLPIAFFVLILPGTVSAATPNINAIRPQGAQRGTEVEVQMFGARLADAKDFLFYRPGITMTKLKVVSDGQILATFKIAPDAGLGLYDFRVRTSTGLSELRSFSIGALKEVTEVEPNSEFAKPQPIVMNVTVNGVANNEDVDFYSVTAKKGERITAEVEGIRLGVTTFDPYVAIMNAKRFELAASDDSALDLAGWIRLDRRSRRRRVCHPGPRKCLCRQRLVPLSPPCRQLSQADRHHALWREARGDHRRSLDRRRSRRKDDKDHAPGPARQ